MKIRLRNIQFKNIYHPDVEILHSHISGKLSGRFTKDQPISLWTILGIYDRDILGEIEVMVKKESWEKDNLKFTKLPLKKKSQIIALEYPEENDKDEAKFISNEDFTLAYIKIGNQKSEYQINSEGPVIFEIDKNNILSGIWFLNIIETDECS